MTIAAGLLCQEGVLVCADTEHVAWETKSQECKIHSLVFPGGRAVFAYAGNDRFAVSAIQKCEKRLKAARSKTFDPQVEIESVLDKEYRRNVLSHPSQASDGNLHYQFLIAIWVEKLQARLFITSETAMTEVHGFECIGMGEPLARQLIRPAYSTSMPYCKALPLAAYALSLVKDNVKDCDGISVFTLLGHDGTESLTTSEPLNEWSLCTQVERYAKGYDFLTKRLFLLITDPTNDEYFEKNLQSTFTDDAVRMFSAIRSERKKVERSLAQNNPHLTEDQVKIYAGRLSMGLLPVLPPSQESPGGSGES